MGKKIVRNVRTIMENKEQKIKKVAVMLAAAYWRGRLESLRVSVHEFGAFESMIEAASNADADSWKSAAKVVVD